MLRKLALTCIVALGTFFVAAASADAGGCPRNTSCAYEMRPDVVKVATAKTVTKTICISQANWSALLSYWRSKGKTGGCFWGAQSTDHRHLTAKIYARCGSVSLVRGKVYGYDGRTGQSHHFGPY